MPETSTCSRCGAEMRTSLGCPRCLLEVAAAPESELFVDITGDESDVPSKEDIADSIPNYEIGELIGQGGMGVVFAARDTRLDRPVAVKVLTRKLSSKADFADRFLREAQALARLNHPNIVTVFDYGKKDDIYYLVMELVDGVDLRRLIVDGGLGSARALALVPQICDALQYAHEQGIVHRDIKPENILVRLDGTVKIADFGLAKMTGRQTDLRLTDSRTVMGTPQYMAPEQVERPREVDHRADIFALGVVFYEMLTGELPIGRFPPPSSKVEIDVRVDDIVMRTLEKEPDLRYQRASDVREVVDQVRTTPEPRRSEQLSEAIRRRRRIAAIAILVILVIPAVTAIIAIESWKSDRTDVGTATALSPFASLSQAIANGRPSQVRQLIDGGAPLHPTLPHGRSLLMDAVERGDLDILEILMGCLPDDVDRGDQDGNTALTMALSRDWQEGAELLLSCGADASLAGPRGRTPLMIAAASGSVESLERILAEIPVIARHVRDTDNENAIHKAARAGRTETLRILIANELSFHFINERDMTPLDLAVSRGHTDAIAALMAAGASPTVAAFVRQSVIAEPQHRLGLIHRAIELFEKVAVERIEIQHGVTSTIIDPPAITLRVLALEILMSDSGAASKHIEQLKQAIAQAWPKDQPAVVLWQSRIFEGPVMWRKIRITKRDLEEWRSGSLEVVVQSSSGTAPQVGIWNLL